MPTYTPQGFEHSKCPDFNLPATDGRRISRKDFNGPFLVMFICVHCPYVLAIEDRLITLGEDMKKIGVPVVAICANDANDYPDDSFENMQKRAISKNYTFPYLHDESQNTAKAFGAVCTPDFFMYDKQGQLAYRGRLDDSWKEPSKVSRRELFEAAKLLAAGKPAPTPAEQTPSMGCSIKWKK